MRELKYNFTLKAEYAIIDYSNKERHRESKKTKIYKRYLLLLLILFSIIIYKLGLLLYLFLLIIFVVLLLPTFIYKNRNSIINFLNKKADNRKNLNLLNSEKFIDSFQEIQIECVFKDKSFLYNRAEIKYEDIKYLYDSENQFIITKKRTSFFKKTICYILPKSEIDIKQFKDFMQEKQSIYKFKIKEN